MVPFEQEMRRDPVIENPDGVVGSASDDVDVGNAGRTDAGMSAIGNADIVINNIGHAGVIINDARGQQSAAQPGFHRSFGCFGAPWRWTRKFHRKCFAREGC